MSIISWKIYVCIYVAKYNNIIVGKYVTIYVFM